MKYIVGFSGGIDSTYTAYQLKNSGNEVILVYLLNVQNLDKEKDKHLKTIAEKLGVQLLILDIFKEFKDIIIKDFVNYYANGKTPNPCVLCNPNIKFKFFEQIRKQYGYDYIVTGHYAQIFEKNNKKYISLAKDPKKDQTYMLYKLSKFKDDLRLIDNIEFVLGDQIKSQVKDFLDSKGLLLEGNKQESQDICFIPDNDYSTFVLQNSQDIYPKGNIVDMKGNIIGQHKGIIYYTVGQRSGLGINQKVYVVDVDPATNTIIVGEEADLYKNKLLCKDFFVHDELVDINDWDEGNIIGKIRYHHAGEKIKSIEKKDENYIIEFTQPVRAITRGQHLVLYKAIDGQKLVIGGGEII